MGDNNGKWNKWQRVNLQNKQTAHVAQFQKKKEKKTKTKEPNQKLGRRPKQTFLQRRHVDC